MSLSFMDMQIRLTKRGEQHVNVHYQTESWSLSLDLNLHKLITVVLLHTIVVDVLESVCFNVGLDDIGRTHSSNSNVKTTNLSSDSQMYFQMWSLQKG